MLVDAARELDVLVAANIDLAADTLSPSLGARPLAPTLPQVRAVRADRLDAVKVQAIAILEETRVVLLRSAAGSDRQLAHVQLIAQAVDSTKILLRSS
jgi:hypothetical protein